MYSIVFKIFFLSFHVCSCQNFKLEQVLILSRHNVRTPLSQNLFEYTPKAWPEWKEKSGYLTAKGALLEGYMGKFFSEWLIQEGLLSKSCPNQKSFYAYANTAQRTMASAEAFINEAFPYCNITLHHSDAKKDPIFNPVIHNKSKAFKMEAIKEMESKLKSLHLNTSEEYLENILNYMHSRNCLLRGKCNLVTDANNVIVNTGFKPNVEGPLKISKSVIDSFIMEYYEGFPKAKVAWGTLKNSTEWDTMMKLSRGYHSVIFNTSLVAKDLAIPLLKFINHLFTNKQFKVMLLMGHDANIYTVLKSLRVKPYILKDQYEKVPAGGKIVFQKWIGQSSRESYAKVNYVYQGTGQMREGKALSMINPPKFTLLEFEGCQIDDNGFCPWNDFVKLLKSTIA